MRNLFIAVIALGLGFFAFTSNARKTYTLQEVESMIKAGKFTGTERFIIIHGNDINAMTGDKKTETPMLVPSKTTSVSEPVKEPHAVDTDLIAYDKIGHTRYLVTMAREYYGNADFWPYIYEENKARFGHPDRITPGTTVRIPRLSKFGVDPGNPADLEKAKKLGKEIYARYGKQM